MNGRIEWRVQLRDAQTLDFINDDTGKCLPLSVDLPTSPTLYSDDVGTTITGPLTFSNGAVRFWTDKDVAGLDFTMLTADGRARFRRNVLAPTTPGTEAGGSPSCHIDLDPDEREELLILPFVTNTAEIDTGFDLPANCLIDPDGVLVKVVTPNGALTLDVGLLSTEVGGDANGFVAAIVINVAAGAYATSTAKLGALLGTTVATRVIRYRTDGVAKSITYTPSGAGANGYILIGYIRGI